MRLRAAACLAVALFFSALSLSAQTWRPIGPPGGDVRSLAADPRDPRTIYLGTQDGHIFGSRDGGEHWQLLGRAGEEDTVVFSILVDSRNSQALYAATWSLGQTPGGVFRSADGGRTWQRAGLTGQTVRAIVQSPSNPEILIAGTLSGVFRTTNAGANWERISPENHEDLRNFDSLAVDPRDPRVIYAGTYHLAWKTTDGGRQWFPIHAGMADDSDVMSLSLDPAAPDRVFGSACSGIYHSENGGTLWAKYRGIPNTARRTHWLRQDPKQAATLYSATTEGLWKTTDAGATWRRVTPANWAISALVIHPQNTDRLVIGVEGEGIFVSDDGGKNFRAANEGFSHRQIMDLAVDRERPERMLAVLTNAADPVVASQDGGRTWSRLGAGLKTYQLRHVYAAPDGWWATLTSGGLLRYDAVKAAWLKAGAIAGEPAVAPKKKKGAPAPAAKAPAARPLTAVVNDLAFGRELSLAATTEGLLLSRDRGATWSRVAAPELSKSPVHAVRVSTDGKEIVAVAPGRIGLSRDGGRTWTTQPFSAEARGQLRLFDAHLEGLLVGAENGMFLSRDAGQNWVRVNLPQARIQDLAVVARAWLVSTPRGGLYLSHDQGKSWAQLESRLADFHIPVLTVLGSTPRVLAATSTEGLLASSGAFAASTDARTDGAPDLRTRQPKN
jgi:photosystem II stability/assembly factor-like uncharacterized protein